MINMMGSLVGIGTFVLKLLLMILILGSIILIHEFGHFMWAKKFGVHIYEFSIGMGPLLFTHKGKDKIDYNVRAIPIGGYVSMAGEVYDDDNKVPKKKLMCNKPWYQRLVILAAGVFNNFLSALILLIIYIALWGTTAIKPIVGDVAKESAAMEAGLQAGDQILEVNGHKTRSWDMAQIYFYYKNDSNVYDFKVKGEDGEIRNVKITPHITKDKENKTETKVFGISVKETDTSSPIKVIKCGFDKFVSIIGSMNATIWGLISGQISLNHLSGPVGIFDVVGESLSLKLIDAIKYLVYILAFLSINVGYINILPFPAFDGGHILFILIEKIKGSPVNSKFENTCHYIGFILIFLLMIVVTISDIIKLF